MSPTSQQPAKDQQTAEASKEASSPARTRPKHTRPPLPPDYKELCALCRAGKLFAVQEWFKTHKYIEPERYDCNHWPIGIAIEKGFHSLVEVLLQNGVPAGGRALQRAVGYRNKDIVELMFRFGAKASMVRFEYIVYIGEAQIIRIFIERGADLVTEYPIAQGLIRQTRLFLGIYKSNIEKHPELQFQADMALRHFCEQGNLRGVSLLMWLGANPRAKVPVEVGEDEESWITSLEAAAWNGKLDVIKRLKPDPAKDDVNLVLQKSILRQNMDMVRYWISLGADINHVDAEGETAHRLVISGLSFALNPTTPWYGSETTEAKRFAQEWFSAGAKWQPQDGDAKDIRKVLRRLSYIEAHEFIKLLIEKEVMSADSLGEILDTPTLQEHLKERRAAIAALVPRVQKWVKSEERQRQLGQQRAAARLRRQQPPPPPRSAPEPRVIWNDPQSVRRLSDE